MGKHLKNWKRGNVRKENDGVYTLPFGKDPKKAMEAITLACAAPDLLEACQKALSLLNEIEAAIHNDEFWVLQEIETAIKRATGE